MFFFDGSAVQQGAFKPTPFFFLIFLVGFGEFLFEMSVAQVVFIGVESDDLPGPEVFSRSLRRD